jgi:ribonuclease HI
MKHIYCDGSCHGNPGLGGWGVYIKDGGVEYELFGHGGHTTNAQMELKAAIEAARSLVLNDEATIFTDSEYVVKGITQWLKGWKAKNWMGSKGPVKNVELWKELDQVSMDKKIIWQWIKGHVGHEGNEYADRLANRGTRGESSISYMEQVMIKKQNN